jgi:formylglycine-generating enzyme required for sulfatase activity
MPALAPAAARASAPAAMLRVPAGDYRPFYKGRSGARRKIPVAGFLLDREPVNVRDFLVFVTAHPDWRRSQVKRLFAEPSYLADWSADLAPTPAAGMPVTRVSWFAASAYCECEGKRLPTQAEWEWAAERSEGRGPGPRGGDLAGVAGPADVVRLASRDRAPRPSQARGSLRFAMGRARTDGLVFGGVWEWTSDFNTLLLADPSPGGESSSSLFCGDGFRATDARDYGGFLRFSFRSSLKASYALKNLGFRCAKDMP